MREYEFRGKGESEELCGKWVYGWYVGKTNLTPPSIITEIDGEFVSVPVDPETVGRYIGISDKEGQDIYEDDIINKKHKLGDRYYLIKYDNTIASFVMKKINKIGFESNSIGTETRVYRHEWGKSEVVGNKHDNPEFI